MLKNLWLTAGKLLLAASLLGAMLIPWASASAASCTFNAGDPNCLVFDGSTTVFPVVNTSLTRFPTSFPGTNMSDGGGLGTGSGHGQSSIMAGIVDVAMSSGTCSDANFGANGITPGIYHCADLVDTVVAQDALTLIANASFVHNTCHVASGQENLTKAQVQGIYEGTITNWQQIIPTCPSTTIVPRARIVGSGTRASFLKLAGLACTDDPSDCIAAIPGGQTENAVIAATGLARIDANPNVENAIDTNPGQIGYIGLAFTDPNNIQFCIDGQTGGGPICPSVASVKATGTAQYPFSRNLHLFSINPTSAAAIAHSYTLKQRITDYLTWILQDEGQQLISNIGFVTVGPDRPDWDVNGDHHGNILDIAQVGQSWNGTGPASADPTDPIVRGWIPADVSWDGHINILDIATVGSHWNGAW